MPSGNLRLPYVDQRKIQLHQELILHQIKANQAGLVFWGDFFSDIQHYFEAVINPF